MRQKFSFRAQLRRVTTDTIDVTVRADDESEAFQKARVLLEKYPDPAEDKDVIFVKVRARDPVEINLFALEPQKMTA